MDRRKPGQSEVTTPRSEPDTVQLLSGVFDGKITGTPILMLLFNRDAQPSAYESIKDLFRPGHADYTYLAKYGLRDYRGSTRSWLMTLTQENNGESRTRLYFGSAILGRSPVAGEKKRLGRGFRLLLGFHKIYSRVLLQAARARLGNTTG